MYINMYINQLSTELIKYEIRGTYCFEERVNHVKLSCAAKSVSLVNSE